MNTKSVLKAAGLVVLLGVVLYLVRYSPWAGLLTLENIRAFVQGAGFWSFLLFVVVYAVGSAAFVPGTILTLLGALLFGVLLGTGLNLIGAIFGASLSFFLSKSLGRDFVQGLLRGRLGELNRKIEKNAFSGLLIMRLIPVFPYLGINYGAGLCRIKFKDYFWATFIGMIPGTFVYTYLFAILGETAMTEGISLAAVLQPKVLIPILLFVLLITIPYFVKKRLKK